VIGIGICKQGVQTKQPDGFWGPCVGEVLPAPERCGDGVDSNCNSRGGKGQPEDDGCCQPSGPEVCNGKDDDCNGLIDEGLLNSCGTCDLSCGATLSIDPVDDCTVAGRTCERLKASGTGGLVVNPDAMVMDVDSGLYFMGPNGIRRFDTATGLTDWEVPG